MSHECLCVIIIDTCLRRRNLTLIEERPFLQRWLSLCEPGILFYLQNIETLNDWRDLKEKIHAVAARSAYILPEIRNLARERQAFIGAILPEISAIGTYQAGNPGALFIPEPDPTPEADKEGSGSDGDGGAAGQAGTTNATPKPSPAEPGAFIPMTEEELAALLDEAADDDDDALKMGAML
ncbi:hypothetical protein [Rhizobium fabae]|uniref:Uncharacterized protein n=1 Tax=Rhizobium fabae TaxID=573179 RepID=A0A7W6FJ09_9HYPH|nr:hypothetical protein [Rhizobium fabae]MBB3915560.1 hypothetical protein [Rhizobium fabae]RUM11858.1 hypothetical protein EFB14_15835 [Rhizobium fabae]